MKTWRKLGMGMGSDLKYLSSSNGINNEHVS
jgi:hypothetical protein